MNYPHTLTLKAFVWVIWSVYVFPCSHAYCTLETHVYLSRASYDCTYFITDTSLFFPVLSWQSLQRCIEWEERLVHTETMKAALLPLTLNHISKACCDVMAFLSWTYLYLCISKFRSLFYSLFFFTFVSRVEGKSVAFMFLDAGTRGSVVACLSRHLSGRILNVRRSITWQLLSTLQADMW